VGEWHEVNQEKTWYQLRQIYCDLCGRVIPRRLWIEQVAGAERIFCDEDCAQLYRTYWLSEGTRPWGAPPRGS
jgi:hypothetical protein